MLEVERMDLISLVGFEVSWSSNGKKKRTEKENKERESKIGNIHLIPLFYTDFLLYPLTCVWC